MTSTAGSIVSGAGAAEAATAAGAPVFAGFSDRVVFAALGLRFTEGFEATARALARARLWRAGFALRLEVFLAALLRDAPVALRAGARAFFFGLGAGIWRNDTNQG